jgi:hypothetical protein
MKKIIIGLILSILFLLAAVYLFIPGKIRLENTVNVSAALPAISRVLSDSSSWSKWWPGKTLTYSGKKYKVYGNALSVVDVDIYSGSDTIKTHIELVLVNGDSTTITWVAEKPSGSNPFKRLSAYQNAKSIEKDMSSLLSQFRTFINKPANIYGFTIQKTKVVDSVLISTRRSFDHYPEVNEIDGMIQSLKKYIADNNAKETNHPMLNIMKRNSTEYEVMTAIPIDKTLPETKEFAAKFMLKGGFILEGEVQGGPFTIKTATDQLELYRADHQYTSPAIPYQLLVTDRVKEADTTKWITKLYYPVF